MTLRFAPAFALLSTLALPMSMLAKSPAILMEVRGKTLVEPVRITDPQFLDRYSFFNGPGVFTFGGPEAYAEGSIVDWKAGAVPQVPGELRSYEVRVYWRPRERPSCRSDEPCVVYVVLYGYDPAYNRGFIYLPGKGEPWHDLDINLLYHGHGVEGHWFGALDSWTHSVEPLLAHAVNREVPNS